MNQPKKGTFPTLSPENVMADYQALFTVTLEETGVCYVVYTDDSLTEEGDTRAYAAIYEPDQAGAFLLPIENDWEWELLEHILEQRQTEAFGPDDT